jgi:hypothetical protein
MRPCSARRNRARVGGPRARGRARHRWAFWAVGFVCSLVSIFLTRSARAEPPSPEIILSFDASSDIQKQAIAAIRAHMSDLAVAVVTVSVERDRALDRRLAAAGAVAASRHALGTFDIEVAEDDSLLIFLTEAGGETTLIRRLRPDRQGSQVTLEHAAIVVRSLVEALLDGGNLGIAPGSGDSFGRTSNELSPRETRSTPTTAPATSDVSISARPEDPTEASAVRRRLTVTAGYTTTEFAAGLGWQSGFSAGAQWLATPVIYAGARYTFFPALTLANTDAVVSIGRHPLEALVGYRETGRVALNAELGVVGDRVTRTTVRTAGTLRATDPDSRWLLAVTARGGFSWSPWAPLRASLRFGADLALMRYAYAVDSGDRLVFPGWIRPRVELELAARLW